VKLLLDTHLLIWAAARIGHVPAGAWALMEAPDNSLYFSAASASHPTLAVKASKLEARDQRD